MVSSSARAPRLAALSRLYITDYGDDEDGDSDDDDIDDSRDDNEGQNDTEEEMTMLNFGKVAHN